jgi:hypothetical protein
MKKLLLQYGFTYNEDYFYMVNESLTNGQFSQAHAQIKAMPKTGKKAMILFLFLQYPEITKENKEWLLKHTVEVI